MGGTQTLPQSGGIPLIGCPAIADPRRRHGQTQTLTQIVWSLDRRRVHEADQDPGKWRLEIAAIDD